MGYTTLTTARKICEVKRFLSCKLSNVQVENTAHPGSRAENPTFFGSDSEIISDGGT